jgi:hypothetical protein
MSGTVASRRALAALRHVRAFAHKHDSDGDLATFDVTEMSVVAAPSSCRRILYATKHSIIDTLILAGNIPSKVMILSRPGVVARSYADIVRREALARRASIGFVGDLDPLGLTTYVSLVAGGFDKGSRPLEAVSYIGLDDNWLQLCERELLADLRKPCLPETDVPVALCTVMTPFERDHLDVLDSFIDLASILGERCLAILHAGFTIDLSMASDPRRYETGFPEKLLRHVLSAWLPRKR